MSLAERGIGRTAPAPKGVRSIGSAGSMVRNGDGAVISSGSSGRERVTVGAVGESGHQSVEPSIANQPLRIP